MVMVSFLAIVIPIYIYSKEIIVILVYGVTMLVLTVIIILGTVHSKASEKQKLAEQLLNDIMVKRKYKTTNEIREAWINGLKPKSDDC